MRRYRRMSPTRLATACRLAYVMVAKLSLAICRHPSSKNLCVRLYLSTTYFCGINPAVRLDGYLPQFYPAHFTLLTARYSFDVRDIAPSAYLLKGMLIMLSMTLSSSPHGFLHAPPGVHTRRRILWGTLIGAGSGRMLSKNSFGLSFPFLASSISAQAFSMASIWRCSSMGLSTLITIFSP